jgi:predicted Rdx family selenoprotein
VAEEVLTENWERVSELVIVPYTDGRFVVKAGSKQLYDKAQTGRFPAVGEVARLMAGL